MKLKSKLVFDLYLDNRVRMNKSSISPIRNVEIMKICKKCFLLCQLGIKIKLFDTFARQCPYYILANLSHENIYWLTVVSLSFWIKVILVNHIIKALQLLFFFFCGLLPLSFMAQLFFIVCNLMTVSISNIFIYLWFLTKLILNSLET